MSKLMIWLRKLCMAANRTNLNFFFAKIIISPIIVLLFLDEIYNSNESRTLTLAV